MRLPPDDRTSRAIIRDAALRLFASHGADAVTVRQIAAAARVSPGLVMRHFESKEGLRTEIDAHVVRTIEAILKVLAKRASPDHVSSVVEAVVQQLPSDSAIPGYFRRLLLDGSRAGRVLFRRLFEMGEETLSTLIEDGLATSGPDHKARAGFLMASDLAVLLLRDHLTETLGVDPLSSPGMKRWAGEVLAIYSSGLGAAPAAQKTPESIPAKPGKRARRGASQQ